MESVDICTGKMRENTCESLQLMLLKEQLIYVKVSGFGFLSSVFFFLLRNFSPYVAKEL